MNPVTNDANSFGMEHIGPSLTDASQWRYVRHLFVLQKRDQMSSLIGCLTGDLHRSEKDILGATVANVASLTVGRYIFDQLE